MIDSANLKNYAAAAKQKFKNADEQFKYSKYQSVNKDLYKWHAALLLNDAMDFCKAIITKLIN